MGTLAILAPLILQYGLPFVADLVDLFSSKETVTGNDLRALHAKYGSTTAAQYLAQAQGASAQPPVPSLPVDSSPTPAPVATPVPA